jgi:hypothetical protein
VIDMHGIAGKILQEIKSFETKTLEEECTP